MEQDPDNEREVWQRVLALSAELHATVQRLNPKPATTGPQEPEPLAAPRTIEPMAVSPPVPDKILEMLRWMCDPAGYTYKEIAVKMGNHPSTLREYRDRIAERYGVKGKAAIVGWAVVKKLV